MANRANQSHVWNSFQKVNASEVFCRTVPPPHWHVIFLRFSGSLCSHDQPKSHWVDDLGLPSLPATFKYQLLLTNPHNALHDGKHAANKGGHSVW